MKHESNRLFVVFYFNNIVHYKVRLIQATATISFIADAVVTFTQKYILFLEFSVGEKTRILNKNFWDNLVSK